MENVKITGRQLRLLVILYVVGGSILFAPATLATEAKQDAWIASLLSIVVGLLIGLMFTKIFHAYPGLSIVQITEEVLGKWVGKILAILFFIFTYLLASLVLRNLGEFMATEILPDTPIQFIHMLILPVVIMGVVYGLNVLHITVLGVQISSQMPHSSYYLAKKINVGNFFTRIEIMMAVIWFITLYFKATLCFLATLIGITHIFHMSDARLLAFPLGLILVVFSLIISPNITYFYVFVAKIWTPYAITFGFIFPVLLLLFKKKYNYRN